MHTVSLRLLPIVSALGLGLLVSPASPAANQSPGTPAHHQQSAHLTRHAHATARPRAQRNAHGTRTLALYKVHTLQHFRTVFWRNGHFDRTGMRRLDHFLRDEHNNRERRMDPHLIMLLWRIQQKAGGRPIGIVSAYRSPTTNHELRQETDEVAKHSMHPLGRAADIRISGWTEPQTYRLARRMHAGGVGYYNRNKFVHVDTGRIRVWGGH